MRSAEEMLGEMFPSWPSDWQRRCAIDAIQQAQAEALNEAAKAVDALPRPDLDYYMSVSRALDKAANAIRSLIPISGEAP